MIRTTILVVTMMLASANTVAEKMATTVAVPRECVVLLHGLFRTRLSMKALQWALDDAGYDVVSQSYPSLSYPIEQLALMAVDGGVQECHARGLMRINFVSHSLGGILLRQYLAGHEIAGLRRVVMLGPPNQGSQLADFIYAQEFLRPFMSDAMVQLGTGEDSVPLHLGPVSFELGIIAGTVNSRSKLPGFPKQAGDGTVSIAETIVPGMLDFMTMPVGHTFMMWNKKVTQQVIYFLKTGHFDRGNEAELSGGEA